MFFSRPAVSHCPVHALAMRADNLVRQLETERVAEDLAWLVNDAAARNEAKRVESAIWRRLKKIGEKATLETPQSSGGAAFLLAMIHYDVDRLATGVDLSSIEKDKLQRRINRAIYHILAYLKSHSASDIDNLLDYSTSEKFDPENIVAKFAA